MNTPQIKNTVKIIENLKNSKGEYSDKNKALVDLLKMAIKLKGLGCNFVVNRQYGKDGVYISRDGTTCQNHDPSKMIKDSELANLLSCLSLTMEDRAFCISYNSQNNVVICCISLDKFPKEMLTREKGKATVTTTPAFNPIDNTTTEITVGTKKGVRPVNEQDISDLKTAFNAMLGLGYNKKWVEKVGKKEIA